MLQLTDLAHSLIRSVIRSGDVAIDATVGNGHDTQFLAECVGPTGVVHGFDIQRSAIVATCQRLTKSGHHNVRLHERNHAELKSTLPDLAAGSVSAVTLNLGYLPGGDRQLTTQVASTIDAMRQALTLLTPGGIMTIIAYTGHPGGAAEALAIQQFLRRLPTVDFKVHEPFPVPERIAAPRLFVVHARLTKELGDETNCLSEGRSNEITN